jgi:hypothetical protein
MSQSEPDLEFDVLWLEVVAAVRAERKPDATLDAQVEAAYYLLTGRSWRSDQRASSGADDPGAADQ